MLGADRYLVSSDAEAMKAAAFSLAGLVNTVSAVVDLAPLLGLLGPDGKMVYVGAPDQPLELPVMSLLFGERAQPAPLRAGRHRRRCLLKPPCARRHPSNGGCALPWHSAQSRRGFVVSPMCLVYCHGPLRLAWSSGSSGSGAPEVLKPSCQGTQMNSAGVCRW